jgi:hypothetical protein
MKYQFIVTLDVPDQVIPLTREDAQAYVLDGVSTMMGCYHPTDPILQTKRVTVRGVNLPVVESEIGYKFFDPEYDL